MSTFPDDLDRLDLAMDVIDRVPRLRFVAAHGEDLPRSETGSGASD